jgi:hypothetical protein
MLKMFKQYKNTVLEFQGLLWVIKGDDIVNAN